MLINELLAKKIDLENKWNTLFLHSGHVTVEMNVLDQQLKEVKRELNFKSTGYYNTTNHEIHTFAG
tara:strand:- start:14 stop:211 length:198 start_codon:yes stop_codon:yes gene_type:complete